MKKTKIVGAFPGSVPVASSAASNRCHRPSRPRRRRHRTRRSVKNRYGSWVTLPRPRPRPAQLAPAPLATISVEDREKTREMATQASGHLKLSSLASAATQTESQQMDGPTSQDDDLRAQVKALQREVRDDAASKQTLYSRLCGAREDNEEAEKANAALLQQVRDLQGQVTTERVTFQQQVEDLHGQVMAGQARLQEAAANIGWQQRRISQLQEELRIQGELRKDLEDELDELQAQSSAVVPTGGGMDAVYDAMAFAQHVAQQDREREASKNFW